MGHVLLVHPPVALPSEPPPGPPALAGALAGHTVTLIDASIEAFEWVVAQADAAGSAPQARRLPRAWDALHTTDTYAARDRHDNALHAAARGLDAVAAAHGPYRLSLTDYVDRRRDPFSSCDLLAAAAAPDDHLFAGYVRDRLLPRVAALHPAPDVVGLSLNYRQQALPALAIAGALRRAFPRLPLVAGGGLVTAWLAGRSGEEPGTHDAGLGPLVRLLEVFDGLVAGDGAPALRAWLEGPAAIDAAPGVVRRSEGRIGRNPPARHRIDPPPRFDGLPLGRYLAPSPLLAVASSRGCYWRRCAFCPEALRRAEGFAFLDGAALLERLATLAETWGARHVHLADSAIAPGTLTALAAAGLAGDVPERTPEWYGFARFEAPLLDPAVCRGLHRAGCRALQLGLESGSERLLALIGKGIRPADAARALANLHAAGIATVVYVLVGLPTETLAEAAETHRFLRENAASIDFLHASVMNLPIGAPLDRARDDYLLPNDLAVPDFPGDLSLCRDLRSTGREDRRALRRYLAREILRDPLIRPMIRDLPPQLGANHVLYRAALRRRPPGDRAPR